MGLNSLLSEGHLMKLRVDYRLAERDQFEGLDELLLGMFWHRKPKAPASNAGTMSFGV